MSERRDFEEVIYNEDGSWTVNSSVTHTPASKAEMAKAWTVLGLIVVAPLIPFAVEPAINKVNDLREKRKAKKNLHGNPLPTE